MSEIRDLIIIGSGPAGLSAAIYAQRAKLNTIIFEKAGMSGGQAATTYEVDNYPGLPGIGGFELGQKMRTHADQLGAEFINEEVLAIETDGKIKTVKTENATYNSKTLLIATGASYAKLKVPGEERFLGMGVSYCATCDGAFYKNKTVAVVGGGNVAIEDAIFLARTCEKVYLVHRRDELRGAKGLQEALFKIKNVEILWDSEVQSIQGESQVEKMVVLNKKTKVETVVAIGGIFIAVGIQPITGLLKGKVNMDEGNYIMADERGITSEPGVFVAGDLRRKELRQIITAASDGANAITSIEKYLIEY